MAKQKNTQDKNQELQEALKNIQRYVEDMKGNFRAVKSAEYALRQIAQNGSYNFNVIMSDKDFTKEFLSDAQAMDAIHDKLVSRLGDADLIENLTMFKTGITEIQNSHREFIESFYEKEIGHGRDIEKYKKQKAEKEKASEKAEEKEVETAEA